MKKPLESDIESALLLKWDKENIYAYKPEENREQNFVIDTPPPTISGSLHIGHLFSYTQTDILARFHRMLGKNVFYPMGWDNNGLPTEKRVQNLYKINCNPRVSASESFEESDPKWQALLNRVQNKKLSDFQSVSRKAFIQICLHQTKKDQEKYKELWKKLALSVDWSQTYETISPYVQNISQKSFLDLYLKGLAENKREPVFWDTQFKTAVAQADMEDRKKQGFYHDILFTMADSKEEFIISTTRPELLPACVAVTAHPKDDRYKKFFYKQAVTPLFYAPVPVLPSESAAPEKGSGILMVCTFGDIEDLKFWNKINASQENTFSKIKLPLRQIITEAGFIKDVIFKDEKSTIFTSQKPDRANKYYSQLKGLRIQPARKQIVQMLMSEKKLVSEPKPKEQFVKFYEKGDFPLELLPARQWYINLLDYKEELLQQGSQIHWHPPAMFKRYEQWVEGLNQNWCISRQRFFGVSFPLWYAVDEKGQTDYKQVLLPQSSKFFQEQVKFIDPLVSTPADWNPKLKHYTEDKRNKPGGFTAEAAVMDTWASSSLSPQINSGWLKDNKRHEKLFPADLRPQAHEIIRTWAFYTIAKSFFHCPDFKINNIQNFKTSNFKKKQKTKNQNIPWKNIAISGWVMNPDRLKMSKSKGKNIDPQQILDLYGADAARYWAGKAGLGQDRVFDENTLKQGSRLYIKLKNAFNFIQIQNKNLLDSPDKNITKQKAFHCRTFLLELSHPIDQAWIKYLFQIQQKTGRQIKCFLYAQALDNIEKTFWRFCDDYLELVKGRAYQLKNTEEGLSAVRALDLSMYLFVKMLSPYMPYITDYIWRQRYDHKSSSSVHTSSWFLQESEKQQILSWKGPFQEGSLLDFCFFIIQKIREFKALKQKSLSSKVKKFEMNMNEKQAGMFEICRGDLIRAGGLKADSISLNIVEKQENSAGENEFFEPALVLED